MALPCTAGGCRQFALTGHCTGDCPRNENPEMSLTEQDLMASQEDSNSQDEGIFTFGMAEDAPPMQPPQPIRRLGLRTRRPLRSRSRSSHRGIHASPSPRRSPRERPVSAPTARSASSRTQSSRRRSRSRSRRSRSVGVVGVAQSPNADRCKQIGTCGICCFAIMDNERRYKKCMQHYSCGANNAALQDKLKTEPTIPVILFKSLFYL